MSIETAQLLANALDNLADVGVFIGFAIFANAFLRK